MHALTEVIAGDTITRSVRISCQNESWRAMLPSHRHGKETLRVTLEDCCGGKSHQKGYQQLAKTSVRLVLPSTACNTVYLTCISGNNSD